MCRAICAASEGQYSIQCNMYELFDTKDKVHWRGDAGSGRLLVHDLKSYVLRVQGSVPCA